MTLTKPYGAGGPGYRIHRLGPLWRWRAWPHENAGRTDWFSKAGFAISQQRAERCARDLLGIKN